MTTQTPKKRRWIYWISAAVVTICCVGIVGVAGLIAGVAGFIYYGRNTRDGPPLHSVESSTPGTVLMIKEKYRYRMNLSGYTAVVYEFTTSGIAPQKGFTFYYYPLSRKEAPKEIEVEIDTAGQVIDPKTGNPFTVDFYGFAKGEPITLGLISSDEHIQTFGKIVPFPIESSGETGCHVSVELGNDTGTLFVIRGEGFVPGEVLEDGLEIDENGEFREFLFPAVIGKVSGTVKRSFIGEQCKAAVEFEWGLPAVNNKQ